MDYYHAPAVSIAVVQGGRVIWAKAYGVRDGGNSVAVTSRTLFQAASISKPVAAYGLLKLVDQKRIDLDADVNGALKSWRVPSNQFTDARKVTLRHLLTHTAGFMRQSAATYWPGETLPSLVDVLQGIGTSNQRPLIVESPVGGQVHYSGAGYGVAQLLAQDVSGKSFEEFMKAVVFGPLAMEDSTFEQVPPPNADVAIGHPKGHQIAVELAAAGLWTTPTDLARFMIDVRSSAAGPGGPLGVELARAMLTSQIEDRGLGFQVYGSGKSARFGHEGLNAGFDSKLISYTRTGQGAVVMVNSNLSYGLMTEVLDSLARTYDWPDYPFTRQRECVPPTPELRAALLGEHDLGDGFIVSVSEKDGALLLEVPEQGFTPLFIAPSRREAFITGLGIPSFDILVGEHGKATLEFQE